MDTSPLEIQFELIGSGWAKFTIVTNKGFTTCEVSYIYDSLKDLIIGAIQLTTDSSAKTIFMNEPGETVLLLNKLNADDIKLSFYSCADWDMDLKQCELRFETVTKTQRYLSEISSMANVIMDTYGESEYHEKWVQHPFPIEEYKKLKSLLD
ncbi:MAG: hypothetical protein EOO45_22030 [Flavobacterium sp.]|nr:MAG: hypothetical protein EOO45_22030 [Flavobacterium sp.]